MVCEDFANQKVFGTPNEHFLPFLRDWKGAGHPFDIEPALALGRNESGNTSIKIMSNYLRKMNAALTTEEPKTGPFPYVYETFKDAIWVYISRRQKDRQALSRITARNTGIYHFKTSKMPFKVGGSVADKNKIEAADQLEYSDALRDEISQTLATIHEEEKVWEDFFTAWDIKPFRIVYERVNRSTDNYLKPLGKRLGYELEDALPDRGITKLPGKTSTRIIKAYREEMAKETSSTS